MILCPARNPRSAPHSKNGCLTCRRRKKKCDERHPTCTACHRNALDCVWPTAEKVVTRRRPRRRQVLSDRALPAELAAMVTVFALPSPELVRRLLHHFTQHGPMWLTTRTGNGRTAILSHLFPEAMGSLLVSNCVLMIAAEDLLKYDITMELQAAAVDYYGQAVAGLRDALGSEGNRDDPASDETLLAVTLFCLHESQNYSDISRMIPHLNGAATLLRRRLHTPPPSLAIRKFLIEMFCYFFSITALTHGPSLAFHDSSHIFDFPGLNTYLQNGTVLGTSQEAFAAVFQLARYLSQSQSDRDPESPTLLTTAQALQTSRPPFQTHPSMSPGTLNDGVTFELHRLACLIHLTQVTSPTTPTLAPSIQAMVASFIAYLAALPLESPSDGFLCWPLVIVGVHAVDRLHQIAIAARLKAIYNRFRSEIFSRNLAFLKGWWRGGRGAGGGGVGEYPVLLA